MVLFGCGQDDNPVAQMDSHDKDVELNIKNIDTNEIINLISFYQYIKREQERNRGIYTSEKLQLLKDSINYDSIMNNRDLPIFEKPE